MYGMSGELTILFFSLVLLAIHIGTQALCYRFQHGFKFSATARDHVAPANIWAGRSERALRNFLETWPAFIVLVLVAELSHRQDALTLWGALIWFGGRLIYLPLYVLGVIYWRSLVWCIVGLGLIMMFFGVLL